MTPAPDSDEARHADPVLDQVAAAARELRDVEEHHRASATRLAEALLLAHQAGFSWSEVARAAELGSAETARARAYRAKETPDVPPSLRWRRERGSTPRPQSTADGLSVTEAAARLQVSRKTIYAWVRNGKLATTSDEAGRTRIRLDDD